MYRLPGTRVDVVDDNPESETGLATELALNDHRARFFKSRLAALRSGRPQAPGTLLPDGSMPESAVINVALQMAFQYPDHKILILLAQPEREA